MTDKEFCAHCKKEIAKVNDTFIPCFGPYSSKFLCSKCNDELLESKMYRARLQIDYSLMRVLFVVAILSHELKRLFKRNRHG